MNIKIVIATHKPYKMPEDDMYIPLHVGAEGKNDIGYIKDNTGENISVKNPNFCELTGLYWAWKNLNADYIGLVHYRRHFSLNKSKNKFDSVLSHSQAENLLSKSNVILPKKQQYYIETLYSHYSHTHTKKHLVTLEEIIRNECPEYLKEFDKLKSRTGAHMFNMFIMKKDCLDSYCEWLFNILFKIEKQIDISKYSSFDARLFGRLSELLLDVWLNTNNIQYNEIPFVYMEKISWGKKIISFLKAKFFGKKYGQSF